MAQRFEDRLDGIATGTREGPEAFVDGPFQITKQTAVDLREFVERGDLAHGRCRDSGRGRMLPPVAASSALQRDAENLATSATSMPAAVVQQ